MKKVSDKITEMFKDVIKANSNNNKMLTEDYCFKINNKFIKIVFSNNQNASTIEEALVKIAIRKFS